MVDPKFLGWLVIPLTSWDVPYPERVSSSLSMLSQARVVKTWGFMEARNNTPWFRPDASFCRLRAVPFSSSCECDMAYSSFLSVLISSLVPVSVLTAYGRGTCLGGLCWRVTAYIIFLDQMTARGWVLCGMGFRSQDLQPRARQGSDTVALAWARY